jgi:hypothetical protein
VESKGFDDDLHLLRTVVVVAAAAAAVVLVVYFDDSVVYSPFYLWLYLLGGYFVLHFSLASSYHGLDYHHDYSVW